MSDIPRHVRLDPLDAGRDSSEVEAPPSYQEVEAEEAEAAAAAAAAAGTLGQPTSRQKPQPRSSRTTTTSSSSSGRLPESHRQYHQHYRSLFSAPAPPSNAQHYSSLLPPVTSAAELSPGIPPNYDVVTSSIPDRFSCRRRAPGILPEGERDIDKERARIQAEKGRRRWGRARSPPKPEGVPLEEVCDRFGNRRREIRPPSTRDMVLNPPSIRRALGNVRISYQGASGAGV